MHTAKIFLIAALALTIVSATGNTNYVKFTYGQMNQWIGQCQATFNTALTAASATCTTGDCNTDLGKFGLSTTPLTTGGCWNAPSNACATWKALDTTSTASSYVDVSAKACFTLCFQTNGLTSTAQSTSQAVVNALTALQTCLLGVSSSGFVLPNFANVTYTTLNTAVTSYCAINAVPTCGSDTVCTSDAAIRDAYFTSGNANANPACVNLVTVDGWTGTAQPTSSNTKIDASAVQCYAAAYNPANYAGATYKSWATCLSTQLTNMLTWANKPMVKYSALTTCESNGGSCSTNPSCTTTAGSADTNCAADVANFNKYNNKPAGPCRWLTFLQGDSGSGSNDNVVVSDLVLECWSDLYLWNAAYVGTYMKSYATCDLTCLKVFAWNNPAGETYSTLATCQTAQSGPLPTCSSDQTPSSCNADVATIAAEDNRDCRWYRQLDGQQSATTSSSDVVDSHAAFCFNSITSNTLTNTAMKAYLAATNTCIMSGFQVPTSVYLANVTACQTAGTCSTATLTCPTGSTADAVACAQDARLLANAKNMDIACTWSNFFGTTGKLDQNYKTCMSDAFAQTFTSTEYMGYKTCENSCLSSLFATSSSSTSMFGALINFQYVILALLAIFYVL